MRAPRLIRLLIRNLPYFGLILAALLVGVLAVQSRRLQEDVRKLRLSKMLAYTGMTLPSFREATLSGDSAYIGSMAPGERQVLFIFNSTCDLCRVTLPGWNRIHDELKQEKNLRVYGITLESPATARAYVDEYEILFPVTRFPDIRTARTFHAEPVPQTLVLDHLGTVVYARAGALATPAVVDSVIASATLAGPVTAQSQPTRRGLE